MQNNDLFRLSFISSNSSNISLKNNLRRIVYSIFIRKIIINIPVQNY